ncbi:hypothetical protein [Phormidium sp. FACHB-1136]|uniref:hypothetical protein n=1 Tax=Phormidium sp. FACHB-1136 TaxID=2692848 RepID=UPI0016833624|nr:hypothetical protein [Phormidium sp. FACHB-1136]MBD2425442.1 hypothetical protein [Phormidium sp. FACHB-1136]
MTLSKFQLQEYMGLFRYLLETDQRDEAMRMIDLLGEGFPPCGQSRQVTALSSYCPPCQDSTPCLPIPSR